MSTTTPEYTITVDRNGAVLHWQGQVFTIEPDDLRGGGWEFEPSCERDHCGDGDCPECAYCASDPGSMPAAVLERWHADQRHPGRIDLCHEQPCHLLADALGLHA